MKGYGQFCPVAKTAEIFAQRWTPLILRELCFGPQGFNDLRRAMPLVARSVLTQRLSELTLSGVIVADKRPGISSRYRLTPAGEAFRPLIQLMSKWGQRWGQGRISQTFWIRHCWFGDCGAKSIYLSSLRLFLSYSLSSQVCPNQRRINDIGGSFFVNLRSTCV